MVDFANRNAALRWFEGVSPEASAAVMVRAALRILPLIVTGRGSREFVDTLVLPSFRAVSVRWTAARLPAFTQEIQFFTFPAPGLPPAAAYAANVLCRLGATGADAASATVHAAHAAVRAASEGVNQFGQPDRSPWFGRPRSRAQDAQNIAVYDSAAAADVAFIDSSHNASKALAPAELVDMALWPHAMPAVIAEAWTELKTMLLDQGMDWEVWTDWYEERIKGGITDSDLELARATLPNSLWDAGPKTVNAAIRLLIDESMSRRLPKEESLPTQTPRAAIFQTDPSGVIGLAPSGPADRLTDTADVCDFYGEIRQKIDDVVSLGSNMLGSRLDRESRKFQSRLPEKMTEAIERLVWSSGNTLRSILAGHDAIAADPDPHPDKLDRAVAERLRDVVDTFNQLAVADPALRERDASRPGPQEYGRSIDEIHIVLNVANQAATDRAITTSQAGDELAHNTMASMEAGSSLPDRLAVELARDTHRNFFAGVMASTYSTMRSAARGDGGFLSKELVGGLYGAVSATALASAISVRWEIVEFIIANADLLKAYAAIAFEHSPGFRQMIEWLEAHVRDQDKKANLTIPRR